MHWADDAGSCIVKKTFSSYHFLGALVYEKPRLHFPY
jgi:hypothetical protein